MEWRVISGFENYSVSNTGLIRNNSTGKILKTRVNPSTGYEGVTVAPFGRGGKYKHLRIHRVVAEAFLPNPDSKPTVNHIDGVKTNNHIINLEWATNREQMVHARDKGLLRALVGEEVARSRLTHEQVQEILDNPQIRNIDFARKFNIDRSAISKIRRGINWSHKRKELTP